MDNSHNDQRHLRVSSSLDLSESTPLLPPDPTPGEIQLDDHLNDNTGMFWEELRILSAYTWPVFGYVFLSIFALYR
jgi:hypothetical protein